MAKLNGLLFIVSNTFHNANKSAFANRTAFTDTVHQPASQIKNHSNQIIWLGWLFAVVFNGFGVRCACVAVLTVWPVFILGPFDIRTDNAAVTFGLFGNMPHSNKSIAKVQLSPIDHFLSTFQFQTNDSKSFTITLKIGYLILMRITVSLEMPL